MMVYQKPQSAASGTAERMSLKGTLEQSEFAQDYYANFFEAAHIGSAFASPLLGELHDMYNTIVQTLKPTDYQNRMLSFIFNEFNEIKRMIDPDKLIFNFSTNYDGDLLLFREDSKRTLFNIIIHQEDDLAFSRIEKSGTSQLDFFEENNNIDFQKLVLQFLS